MLTDRGPAWDTFTDLEDELRALMPTTTGMDLQTPPEADWALRQMQAYQRRIDETNAWADQYIDRIQIVRKSVLEKLTDKIEFFRALLQSFAIRWTGEHPHEGKSIPLPHGTLKLAKQQPEVHRDDDELMAWIQANGLERFVKVKTTYSVDWAGLKKLCDLTGDEAVYMPTGEVVPGIVLEHRPEKFDVKFGVPEIVEIDVPALPEK